MTDEPKREHDPEAFAAACAETLLAGFTSPTLLAWLHADDTAEAIAMLRKVIAGLRANRHVEPGTKDMLARLDKAVAERAPAMPRLGATVAAKRTGGVQ